MTIVCLEKGTCCHRAATHLVTERFSDNAFLQCEQTFDLAISAARGKPDSLVLIPHVHPLCAELTLSGEWELRNDYVFPFANPPLYVAVRPGTQLTRIVKCVALPRLQRLVGNLPDKHDWQFSPADSTQNGARILSTDLSLDACITNENGVKTYGLLPYRQLKHMTIWWMPFTYINPSSCLGFV